MAFPAANHGGGNDGNEENSRGEGGENLERRWTFSNVRRGDSFSDLTRWRENG